VSVATKYASNRDATIAYQVLGDAAHDLLYIPGWFFNPEMFRDVAPLRRYSERLQSFARVIAVEKRGFGMSDRLGAPGTVSTDDRLRDITAVADAEGLRETAVMGTFEGGTLLLLWAAANAHRVSRIVLINSFAKLQWDKSLFGQLAGDDESIAAARLWELFERNSADFFCPDLPLPPQQKAHMSRSIRMAANPGVIERWLPMVCELDARPCLAEVRMPVLVIHSEHDRVVSVDHAKDLAANLPNARVLVLPGRDHVPWGANFDQLMSHVEEFVTGTTPAAAADRGVEQTILFTDIVDSTRHLAAAGDEAWRSLIETHDRIAEELLDRFGGRFVQSTGDGLLGCLPTPDAAIMCARALIDQLGGVGVEIRVGIHTGRCQLYGDNIVGIAVNVAARIMSLARGGEVLVSQSVRDAAANPSPDQFRFTGTRQLKGVPGSWRLYTVG
jgi:class 3 adenylate cyclase